jgi:hypothetical protein
VLVHKLSVYVNTFALGTKVAIVRQGRVDDSTTPSFVTGRGTYMNKATTARIKAALTNALPLRLNHILGLNEPHGFVHMRALNTFPRGRRKPNCGRFHGRF